VPGNLNTSSRRKGKVVLRVFLEEVLAYGRNKAASEHCSACRIRGRATPSSTEDTHADGHNRPLDGGHVWQHRLEYIQTRTQFIQSHIYSSYHDCCVKPATHRHVVVSASGPAFQRLLLPRISRGQVPARLGYCCHNCSLLPPRIKLPNTTELLSLPINLKYEGQQNFSYQKKTYYRLGYKLR
jgi:hypothetical protein